MSYCNADVQDIVIREQIIEALRTVALESVRLLAAVKASAADPNAPSSKQQLSSAARWEKYLCFFYIKTTYSKTILMFKSRYRKYQPIGGHLHQWRPLAEGMRQCIEEYPNDVPFT